MMGLLVVRACLSLALACHVVALTPLEREVSGMTATKSTNTTNPTTTPDFNKVHDNSVGYLVFSVALNGSILVLGLVAFQIGLCLPRTSCFLAPRWNPDEGNGAGEKKWAFVALACDLLRLAASRCRPLQLLPCVHTAAAPLQLDLSAYDDNLIKQMSLDGIMLVRFCLLGFKFCGIGSIASIILIPLYATGSLHAEGFQVYSLSNVDDGSPPFWIAIVGAYALLALFVGLVLEEWKTFMKLRQKHLYQRAIGKFGPEAAQAQRSLRVEFFPPGGVATPIAMSDVFEDLFGRGGEFGRGSVKCCVLHTSSFANAVGDVASYGECLFGSRRRERHVTILQDGVGGQAALTAYVTLCKVTDRIVAEQVSLCDDHHTKWRIYPAVDAHEILWSNAADPENVQWTLKASFLFVRVFGYLFWSVLVIGVQAWANLESWTSPAVRKFCEGVRAWTSPFLYSFMWGYLPVIALMLLLLAVPYALELISTRWERVKTESQMTRDVIRRNFTFQLVSLYVIVASTSLFSSMKQIIKEPESAFMLLRNQIPTSSNYFINFVLARTGITLSMYLLRPWDWPSKNKKVCCMFGTEAVYQVLVFTLGLTYSFVAPAMLPVCALYFGLASLVYTWLFKYVYEPKFDVSGGFWYDLFEGSTLGLFLGTLTMTGVAFAYVDIKRELALACAPLPIAVICFYFYCRETYMKLSYYMPLQQARKADRNTPLDVLAGMDPAYYNKPSEEDGTVEMNSQPDVLMGF